MGAQTHLTNSFNREGIETLIAGYLESRGLVNHTGETESKESMIIVSFLHFLSISCALAAVICTYVFIVFGFHTYKTDGYYPRVLG